VIPADLNILAAWLGILAGVLLGVAQGLFFHDENWLGGYASWRRRLMRLGHVSFFGIAGLNLAFTWTVKNPLWKPDSAVPAAALALAQALMPAVCYLAAWHKPMRRLFFLPVTCVLVGAGGIVVERLVP
jgi:hypothetical protein